MSRKPQQAVKLTFLARDFCVLQIMYRRAEKRLRKGFRPAAHSFLTRFRKSTQYEGQSHASKTLSKRKLHVLHAALEDSATGDTPGIMRARVSLSLSTSLRDRFRFLLLVLKKKRRSGMSKLTLFK